MATATVSARRTSSDAVAVIHTIKELPGTRNAASVSAVSASAGIMRCFSRHF